MASTSIKILTYNIHKGMNYGNRRFVLNGIRHNLREVDADLVLLQEIHGQHAGSRKMINNWPNNNQLEYLADSVWQFQAYGKNAIYKAGHHGNAILSKYPLVDWENIDVSLLRRTSRSLLHGVIQAPDVNQKLHIICVHLGLFGFERDHQFDRLVAHIESIAGDEPLIVAGDFNDWRGRAKRYLNAKLGLREVFQSHEGGLARTFPSWMPLLQMDRVYVRGVEVIASQRLLGQPWRSLSDHIPLLVECCIS